MTIPVIGVTITPRTSSAVAETAGNRQSTATVAPQNVTNKIVAYSITSVINGLTVPSSGNIAWTDIVPAGKYTTTIKTEDGSHIDTHVLTLTEPQEGQVRMEIKDGVKKLLSGSTDDKLEAIERRTRERLASLLGVSVTPKSLEYIVFDVTNKRFNRIGQEGMTSYTQEGLPMAFPDSDLPEYASEIDDFKRRDDEELYKPRKESVWFL